MSLTYLFEHGDAVLLAVFILLVAMSLATWSLILAKAARLRRMKRANTRFSNRFWQADDAEEGAALAADSPAPLARIAHAGLTALHRFRATRHQPLGERCSDDEFLLRAIRNAMNREGHALQNGMALLASIGSTAPYIGLFGTVWGIYHALLELSTRGSAELAVVAGPLGEALVATAAGLAVAVPAVLAFNAFSRGNRVVLEEMDAFAHDLHAFVTTGEAA